MSDPISTPPTSADVQREQEAAAEFGAWTQHFTDGPILFQFDTSAMVKEIAKLRARVQDMVQRAQNAFFAARNAADEADVSTLFDPEWMRAAIRAAQGAA